MIQEIFKPPIEQAEEEARIRNAKLEELKRRRWLGDDGDNDLVIHLVMVIVMPMEMVTYLMAEMLIQTIDFCMLIT